MIVKNQLKHLLVLLQESGSCTVARLSKLLFYTPIKAEVASEKTTELLILGMKLGLVYKQNNSYFPRSEFETKYIDKLTANEMEVIKSSVKKNYQILVEIAEVTATNGRMGFNQSNIMHRLLFELGFVKKTNDGYYLAKELLDLLKTEDIIWKFNNQKENIEVGIFAEKVIYNLEFDNLSTVATNIKKLKHVSLENDALGYDIKSYDPVKKEELYLEVKGTTLENVRFFLTSKELEVAEKFKNNYRIKVVCGINLRTQTYSKIVEIPNPSTTLFKLYKVETQLYKISELDFA